MGKSAGEETMIEAPKNPPKCPNCGLAPWRNNRGVVQTARVEDGKTDETRADCCVCMHCSNIWALDRAAWAWRPLTEEEMKHAGPHLIPIAMRFTMQRLAALFDAPKGNA